MKIEINDTRIMEFEERAREEGDMKKNEKLTEEELVRMVEDLLADYFN